MEEPTRAELVQAAYLSVRRMWDWALLTPIVYLFIGWGVRVARWISTDPLAPHGWDTPLTRILTGAVLIALAAGLVRFRWARRTVAGQTKSNPAEALRRWRRNFLWTAVLADSMAFLGLVFFLISGRFEALLAGGAAAYAGYGLAYPGRSELAPLAPPPPPPD